MGRDQDPRELSGSRRSCAAERASAPDLRILLALVMFGAGVFHFTASSVFLPMVPPWLPAPGLLVSVSGVFEMLGGLGLLLPKTRRLASYGLVALYIAVFPANVHMALHPAAFGPPLVLWLRLPLQGVFIAWALWVGREPEKAR